VISDNMASGVVQSTGNPNSGDYGTAGGGGGFFRRPDTSQGSAFHNNIVAENSAVSDTDLFGYYVNPFNNLIGKAKGQSE
jgi:hypothetical protein